MEKKKGIFLFINQDERSQLIYWVFTWFILFIFSIIHLNGNETTYTKLLIFTLPIPLLIFQYFIQKKPKRIPLEFWPHLHGFLSIILAFQFEKYLISPLLFLSFSLYNISLLRIYGFAPTLLSGVSYLLISCLGVYSTQDTISFQKDIYLMMVPFFIFLFSGINSLVKAKVDTLEDQRKDLEKKNSNLNQYLEKFWDLTSHFKDQNKKLKDLDEQKTNFFQSLSHELRTPITLIENPLNECSKRYPEDKELKVALKNSTRLNHLVNQLLNFQKAVVNKDKVKLSPINLIKFCENVSKTFSPTCESNKLKFNFLINEEPFDRINIEDYRFYIEVNLDSLEKILFNLLANAFKYSPRNGLITLSLTKKENDLRIGVLDEGPGIPKKDHQKIFQSFVQVNSSNGKEGTGLGLSLVKELAETMKGSVGVESDGKKGTFFWVDFPSFNPRNIIDFVLIIPKKEDTSDYRKLFLKDFTWEKIHTLKELKNFSNLFYPKIILIDPRLEDSQENLELWENITDSIPDSYFLSLEKDDKVDNELKSIIKKKVAESLIKDRPILFDYELRDLLIISLKDIYLNEYDNYLEQAHKGKSKRKIDFVQTITEAKKRLKGNKYKAILIDLTNFEYEGIHLLKFSHLISSLTKKVALINPDVLKRLKKDIMDVPYIDRYFISFDFSPVIRVMEDYITSSKIISTESYALKNWIFEYRGKSDDSGEEEQQSFFEFQKDDLKTDIGAGLTLLVIDDLKDMRSLLKNILLPHGYKVVLAKNVEEGLDQVGKVKPDLIIVDWMMGETNGIDFIKTMRTDKNYKTTPIILLTAKSDEESRAMGIKSGADAFLGKPFNEVELVSMVRNLTRLKENEKKLSERSHNLLVSKMEMEYLMDEIYHQQKNQREILNTIPEALLLFDENGVISDVGSKVSEEIFGKSIFKSDLLSPDENNHVWEILELNIDEINTFKIWLKKAWEGKMAFKDLLSLAPKTFKKNEGKYVELTFAPIYSLEDEKRIIKMVLVGKDRTKEKELEENIKKEIENSKLVTKALEYSTDFIEIILDSQELEKNYQDNLGSKNAFFRFVHTLKARMSFFQMNELINIIHDMENSLFNKNEEKLIRELKSFKNELNKFAEDNFVLIETCKRHALEDNKSIPTQEILKLFNLNGGIDEIKEKIYSNYVLTDLKSNFFKFKKYTEEVSVNKGKLINFEIEGELIKINKIKLKSFLNSSIHLFRNMIDHGIEDETIRIDKKKPKEGTIKTNFTIEKDMIKMSFEDDGAGLDLDKIKNKCIEKNLLSKSDLSNMTNQDLFAYIFKPEFSTNESVNLISGRGIGMESLKEEVDNLNGSIEIQSQKDEGTTFIIKVPLKEAS